MDEQNENKNPEEEKRDELIKLVAEKKYEEAKVVSAEWSKDLTRPLSVQHLTASLQSESGLPAKEAQLVALYLTGNIELEHMEHLMNKSNPVSPSSKVFPLIETKREVTPDERPTFKREPRKYKCTKCGVESVQRTNHYGDVFPACIDIPECPNKGNIGWLEKNGIQHRHVCLDEKPKAEQEFVSNRGEVDKSAGQVISPGFSREPENDIDALTKKVRDWGASITPTGAALIVVAAHEGRIGLSSNCSKEVTDLALKRVTAFSTNAEAEELEPEVQFKKDSEES